jgi:hypothetical protein
MPDRGKAEMDEKRQHSRPGLIWPVILITIGVLFLLSNLGVLNINFWELWRLWPVLLILVGLDLIIGRRSALGNLIALVLALLVIAGAVFLLVVSPDTIGLGRTAGNMQFDEPLDGVERADFQIGFAAGTLDIGRLEDSDSLIEGDLQLVTNRQPVWDFSQTGDNARLVLEYATGNFQSWNGRGDQWNLALSPRVAFSLDANVGAGEATMDLTGLDIRSLRLETGAGRNTVILPENGRFDAKITGGVGQLVVEIPPELAARIQVDRGLGAANVSRRFERQGGDVYESADWETNENRVTLQIEVGIGQVNIRDH